MKLIYEGKAKKIFQSDKAGELVMQFKDSLTAFNAQKKGSFEGKGALNLKFSLKIFEILSSHQVRHHFLQKMSDTEVVVRKLTMLPVEVVVRNFIAGSLATRLGKTEGEPLKRPLVEFYFKNDSLNDPMLTENQILVLEILSELQLKKCTELALKINEVLLPLFREVGVQLIDFKIEVGQDEAGLFYLADEISPDSCRFWDALTKEKLDKDVFRRDLGSVENAYLEIARKIGVVL
jgi:phosphoribosylaminoimidazole-succinocarboxamide synthase